MWCGHTHTHVCVCVCVCACVHAYMRAYVRVCEEFILGLGAHSILANALAVLYIITQA